MDNTLENTKLGGKEKMDTNSTSQTKNGNEDQTGCEACIKKDELITDLYEALRDVKIVFDNMSVSRRITIAPVITNVNQALAKVTEVK